MLKASAITVALIAAAIALPAAAQGYVGIDAGRSRVSDSGLKWSGSGAAIFGGWQVNDALAIEAGYRNLGSDKVQGIHVKANSLQLSALGMLPLSKEASLYGRLGINTLKAEASANGFTAKASETRALIGAGMRYAVTKGVSLRLEVQKPDGDTTTLAGGVEFRF